MLKIRTWVPSTVNKGSEVPFLPASTKGKPLPLQRDEGASTKHFDKLQFSGLSSMLFLRERNTPPVLKNWRYFLCHFEGSEKLGKKLRKTTDLQEYKSITHEIFTGLPFRSSLQPDW